ncbi:MAG: ATP-binding protein [Chloroflexi bacterium]|nr:MAG: ATP-binding protein [Chloroflexota bacterium]MBL1196931.1 ATP-binding protein [Chloroflexota bacterium]NOH14227.1 ATP-binding protein [Chloroflexota bacterium]
MSNVMVSWDPLVNSKDFDAAFIATAKKREIKNILKSYVGSYDPFSELIQNAMDAVDERAERLNEAGYERKLSLTVDLDENTFTVTDNGIGFTEQEFKAFLAPNISFKNREASRGNKGVGATYIGYGFDYLQMGTKGDGFRYSGEIENGRKWVEDKIATIPSPKIKESNIDDSYFNEIDRGSTFKLRFGGAYSRPKDLSWYAANTPDQWLYLLLIKTPLGSIDRIKDAETPILFDLTVVDKNGEKRILENQYAKYIFPHTRINASTDLKEMYNAQQKLLNRKKDPSDLAKKYNKLNGIFEFYSTDELKELRIQDKQEAQVLIDQYQIEAYGFFTYSTSVWDRFNDSIARLRKGMRIIKGGLQLANNNMPQGELITIPLTSNIGYQNQCHVIVHFVNADPDLGRKGFQPELREVSEKIAVSIVNNLKNWKSYLKSDTGAVPDLEKEVKLHNWIKDQEKHEEEYPLVIENKNFFNPLHEISITSIPQSEQDVIVLFNQLIAGGVIRGIKLLSTSQVNQYDGLFKFVAKNPLANLTFDNDTNPLGIAEIDIGEEFESKPKVLEYKFNMDALIQEFQNEEKKEKEIDLVITWEIGDEWKKSYDVLPLLDLSNLHQREFHGITHKLSSGTSTLDVIVLKELTEYLNDIETAQDYQKETYGEDDL